MSFGKYSWSIEKFSWGIELKAEGGGGCRKNMGFLLNPRDKTSSNQIENFLSITKF
jgi:hypothetical protein